MPDENAEDTGEREDRQSTGGEKGLTLYFRAQEHAMNRRANSCRSPLAPHALTRPEERSLSLYDRHRGQTASHAVLSHPRGGYRSSNPKAGTIVDGGVTEVRHMPLSRELRGPRTTLTMPELPLPLSACVIEKLASRGRREEQGR